MREIEICQIDTRYERARQRNPRGEDSLLSSIAQRGVCDPVHGIEMDDTEKFILLDGFKRLRCARKLGLTRMPAQRIAGDEIEGICSFMRQCESNTLSQMEEAALVDELHGRLGMRVVDIARQLNRSVGWVSMRLGMIEGMSDVVRGKIMRGQFPLRIYMYGLKKFTRVNSTAVDAFVRAVSGRGLGSRDLWVLAEAFLRGSEAARRQILDGRVEWVLRILKTPGNDDVRGGELSPGQGRFIAYLEGCSHAMSGVLYQANQMAACCDGSAFSLRVNVICGAIMRNAQAFTECIRVLYERTGHAAGGSGAAPGRPGEQANSSHVGTGSQDRAAYCRGTRSQITCATK